MAKQKQSNSTAPKGMKMIEGGYAKSWNVEEFDTISGKVSEGPKTVQLTQGKKTVDRRCIEVKTDDGERYTVWESAALGALFAAIEEQAPCKVWIHFTGYGTAKKGQNPPKLFESAIG
jgi:hypothetical protein